MVKEVEKLRLDGISWKRIRELGIEYCWISLYLQNKISYKEMIEGIYKDSIGLSKYQLKWFKKDKRIHWTPPTRHPVLIAAGWRPGWSTDYISVLLAKRFKVKEIIDAGNIPFVYSKDILKCKAARPIKKISWKDYRKLVGSKWIPGLAAPIDPIAAREAQKLKIRVLIIRGTELKNFEKLLLGKKFKGTTIES